MRQKNLRWICGDKGCQRNNVDKCYLLATILENEILRERLKHKFEQQPSNGIQLSFCLPDLFKVYAVSKPSNSCLVSILHFCVINYHFPSTRNYTSWFLLRPRLFHLTFFTQFQLGVSSHLIVLQSLVNCI